MAGKRRFEMSSTGPDVSSFPSTGTPLHAEDPFSESFWKQFRRFFQNDQTLFEDLKREIEDEPAILTTGRSRTGEVKHTWSKLPLAWKLSSAFIVEGDSQESNIETSDGPQDVFSQMESDTENAAKVELEIEPEVHSRDSGLNAEYRGLDEGHALGGQKNQGEWESDFQMGGLISSIALNDTPYQEMNLDKRILLELQSFGVFQETVPVPAWNEEEMIKPEMCIFKDELQHQVPKNKHYFEKVGKTFGKSQKVEDRECEVIAMNTIVESASNRHIGGAGVRRVSCQKQGFWPMLSGPQIRPLGQPKTQPQAQLDGLLHTGTSSITTAKVRRSRTTRVRRRTTVWGSATESGSRTNHQGQEEDDCLGLSHRIG